MRLEKLTMKNFGIYKGEHTFDFPYSNEQNVYLIIGKNGAGKTTFLNAIKICLFGSMILKNKTITKNYENYILEKLNKDAQKIEFSNFSITATYISYLHNYDGEITIERSWDITSSFNENVCMYRNGKALSLEEQNSFLNALYHAFPLDLFELFHLDGEKIDQLSVLNNNIIELIESSINIDLFKKLKSDLLSYASKRTNNSEIEELNLIKKEKEVQLLSYKNNLEKNYSDTELLNKMIDEKTYEIKNFKESLNIDSMTIDTEEIKSIESEISESKKDIENDLTKFLPFTLVTDQLKKLLNSIDIEIQATKNKVIHDAMSSNELTNHLSKNLEKDTIKNLLESICKFYPYENIDFVHNLSDDNYYSLRNKLSNLLNFSRKQLHNKTKKLNHLEMHLKTLTIESKELNAAKSSGQLDILLTYQSENIDLINNLKINTEKIKEQEIIIDITNKELSVIENQLWNQLKKNNVNNVLDKIHTVLDQYIIRVKKQKITEIEDYTKYMFNLLIRKNNFIKDFKIQDKTIYLLDHNGNKLSHLNLSAGEKQLFVLSMIYAIIKSSERTVPLIFDTLFGRLDEEHRNNVFKAFIKSCPDQVIILATDSEIANIDKESLSSITNKECTIDLSKSEKQMPLLEA